MNFASWALENKLSLASILLSFLALGGVVVNTIISNQQKEIAQYQAVSSGVVAQIDFCFGMSQATRVQPGTADQTAAIHKARDLTSCLFESRNLDDLEVCATSEKITSVSIC